MEDILRVLFVGLALIAAVLLFTSYEALYEAIVAGTFVAAVIVGFAMFPRKDVYYLKTRVQRRRGRRIETGPEFDYVAIRVELVRLWLLFVPTFLAVAFLTVSSARGRFGHASFLNRVLDLHDLRQEAIFLFIHYIPMAVAFILWAWLTERWALRDVEVTTAQTRHVSGVDGGRVIGRRITYSFQDERGELYGGDCLFYGLIPEHELQSAVFYNARKPARNRIATGLLFHRPVVIGRGVTDLDAETKAAHAPVVITVPAFQAPS
jgi:hypothetical protein